MFWALAAIALGLAAGTPAATAQSEQADMDTIFRCQATDDAGKATCAEGRAIIMSVCTRCHTWVRVVRKQADRELWTSTVVRMRQLMADISITDEQAAVLVDYVSANFNESLPPPELPDSIMEAEYPGSTNIPSNLHGKQ
jgi:hypothetical protein